MRKVDDGKRKENNDENSGPLTSLPVDCLTATDCNADARANTLKHKWNTLYVQLKQHWGNLEIPMKHAWGALEIANQISFKHIWITPKSIRNISKNPLKYLKSTLPKTFETHPKQLSVTFQTPWSHLPSPFKHPPKTFQTLSRHPPHTFQEPSGHPTLNF